MNNSPKRTLHEDFAKFFESPTRERFRELLKNNFGEFSHCDFKEQWPDSTKIAKHTLGLANSDGGCMIIGVKERQDKSLKAVGLDELKDKSHIINKINKYIPNALLQELDILDFSFKDSEYQKIVGLNFQVLFVPTHYKNLPYVATRSGKDIKENTVYVRRGTSTEQANYEELQGVINKRISTGYSSTAELNLEAHLQQLKTLYNHIKSHTIVRKKGAIDDLVKPFARSFANIVGTEEHEPNPLYPDENYEQFISTLIAKKKKIIEIELQVNEL